MEAAPPGRLKDLPMKGRASAGEGEGGAWAERGAAETGRGSEPFAGEDHDHGHERRGRVEAGLRLS